jgi:hypothetical protein
MGLVTKVTNSATNQRYIISTVCRMGAWQTAAFKRRLGPLSAFWAPALVLNALKAIHAAAHHDRVATTVRDVNPTNWEKAKRALLMEEARASGDIRQILELGTTASFAEDLAALGFLAKYNAQD